MIMIELPVERVWLRQSAATRVRHCLVIEVSTDSVPDLLNVNATRSPALMPWTEPASLTVNGIVIAGHSSDLIGPCEMVTCCPDTLSTAPVIECVWALLSEGAVAFRFALLISAGPHAATLTASVARPILHTMLIAMLSCLRTFAVRQRRVGWLSAADQRQIGADCKRRRAALQKQAAIPLVLSDKEFRHSPFKPRPLGALGHLFHVSKPIMNVLGNLIGSSFSLTAIRPCFAVFQSNCACLRLKPGLTSQVDGPRLSRAPTFMRRFFGTLRSKLNFRFAEHPLA